MKKLILFSLLVLFMACSKETVDNSLVVTKPVPAGKVDLAAPAPQQKSLFVNYSSNCEDLDGNFELMGDTLVVEVIEENGALLIKEQYTPHSLSVINGSSNEAVTYPIYCDGKKMLIPEREQSHLFFFYGNDTLRLQTNLEANLQQQDCKLFTENTLFTGDEVGYLKSFKVGAIEQQDKMAVSCVPVITIDAYLIHDKNQLYVSHAVYTSNFMGNITYSVQGWALLE